MESHSGVLSRSHRYRTTGKRKSPVTTVQYRSFSLLSHGPVLLTCTQDGSLSFFRLGSKNMPSVFEFNSKHWQKSGMLMLQCCSGSTRLSYSSLLTQVSSTSAQHSSIVLPFAFPWKRRIHRLVSYSMLIHSLFLFCLCFLDKGLFKCWNSS